MRSSWKCPVFDYTIISGQLPQTIKTRGLRIPDCYLGIRITIHTGKKFKSILIKSGMLGCKFGELVPTKLTGYNIHLRGKRKKN